MSEQYPQLYYEELAFYLDKMVGWLFEEDQVRQVFRRQPLNQVYNFIHDFRPMEQDAGMFAFFRQHVVYEGGPGRSAHRIYFI